MDIRSIYFVRDIRGRYSVMDIRSRYSVRDIRGRYSVHGVPIVCHPTCQYSLGETVTTNGEALETMPTSLDKPTTPTGQTTQMYA